MTPEVERVHTQLLCISKPPTAETFVAAATLLREQCEDIERLREALTWALPLAELTLENSRQERLRLGHSDIGAETDHRGLWAFEVAARDRARRAAGLTQFAAFITAGAVSET